jgi:hypothetical protein
MALRPRLGAHTLHRSRAHWCTLRPAAGPAERE